MLNVRYHSRWIPLAGAALALAAGPALMGLDDTSEPAARYTLSIDGEGHALTAGEPVEILIDGKMHTLAIEESDTRILRAAGLRLEYPRMMTFEYEKEPFSKIWTLDGNDSVLMLMQFWAAPSVEEFLDEQFAGYGSLGEVESGKAEIRLLGRSIQGASYTVEAEMFSMMIEVFPLDGPDESKRWLILQDVGDEVGEVSDEYVALKELLTETLTAND